MGLNGLLPHIKPIVQAILFGSVLRPQINRMECSVFPYFAIFKEIVNWRQGNLTEPTMQQQLLRSIVHL